MGLLAATLEDRIISVAISQNKGWYYGPHNCQIERFFIFYVWKRIRAPQADDHEQ
ncbi:MAG: hypothetical protein ACXWFZ_13280 [Nitrososphaeraceae archaeon]